MPPTVAAIIINYQGREVVKACVDSLLAQSRLPDEVWVIDNASEDDIPERIKAWFPSVHVVRNERNLGFAGACNVGIRRCRSDLVAILNNDLILERNWLERLLAKVEEPWGFWASRIVRARQPEVIDSAGDGMAVIGAAFKIGSGRPVEQYLEDREVFGPCGAAALYRRELLEETGGFDEDFFLIYEDSDLNVRARLLGYRCLYVADAVVRHRVNESIGRFTKPYVYYGHRNSEFVFWKNFPTSLLLCYLPERQLFNLLCLAFFARKGRAGTFIRAKRDAFRMRRTVLEKRRRILSSARISAADLRRQLTRNWLAHRWKGW